jgi:SEC-C motif
MRPGLAASGHGLSLLEMLSPLTVAGILGMDGIEYRGFKVVGHDNGHAERPQPRNSPCKCGSGKKAKRCCEASR